MRRRRRRTECDEWQPRTDYALMDDPEYDAPIAKRQIAYVVIWLIFALVPAAAFLSPPVACAIGAGDPFCPQPDLKDLANEPN